MGRYNLDGYVPSVFVSFSKGVHVDSPDVSAVFTPFLGLQRAASFRRYLSATRLGTSGCAVDDVVSKPARFM